MSSHSIAEARERLPELVERAIRGEPVVIVQDGRPVAEIRPPSGENVPARPPGKPVTAEGLAWLDRIRARPARPQSVDSAILVRQMRDEGP